MKVGLVIDRWEPSRGGAERATAKLVTHLEREGDEVHVFALSFAEGAPGVPHVVERPRRLRGAMETVFARRSIAAARRERCDVTIGLRHLEEVDVYWPHGGLHRVTLDAGERSKSGVAGGVSRALHRISIKHRTFLRLEDRVLGADGARVVWCVSPLVRDEIAAAHPASAARLQVHANGVDVATFHPGLRDERRAAFLRRHRIDPASCVLVFPGGNWTLKGWDVLWHALPAVRGPWLLVAAGDEAEFVTTPRGLAERAVLLPRQDARDLWAAADLAVQPTWRDPCSLATLEALASGVPVVTTDANGASDTVRASGVGGVVTAGDIASLITALSSSVERLTDPVQRSDAAARARAAAEARPESAWLAALTSSLRDVRRDPATS